MRDKYPRARAIPKIKKRPTFIILLSGIFLKFSVLFCSEEILANRGVRQGLAVKRPQVALKREAEEARIGRIVDSHALAPAGASAGRAS